MTVRNATEIAQASEADALRADGAAALIGAEMAGEDEDALETLREILLDRYRLRMAELQTELDDVQSLLTMLEEQVNDKEALITTITPVISDAISSSISNSRDEMIEALYPITGRLVSKAVSEAMRDLARAIDNQMRDTFSIDNIKHRARARISGIPESEMMIRTALPFYTEEIFLIHRESGLLIAHLSSNQDFEPDSDSDLISGMLTAIRDFVQDAFGQDSEGQLDSIQYGDLQILIEAGRYAYLAAVVHGYEPTGYRSELRRTMHEIGNEHFKALRDYDGDATQLGSAQETLKPLLVTVSPEPPKALDDHKGLPAAFSMLALTLHWASLAAIAILLAWRLWMLFFN